MEDIIDNINLEDGDSYEEDTDEDTFGEIDVDDDEGDEVLTESYDDEDEDF
jgi:hypothetical protein